MRSALALVLVFFSSLAVARHTMSHKHKHHCSPHSTTTGTSTTAGTSTSTSTSTSHTATKTDTNLTNNGGWVQNPKGNASFTVYSGCQNPSCGYRMNSGYTAAANELAFGASSSHGDACGRCFKITATADPYSPEYKGPFGNSIVVMVTDLCPPGDPNKDWCGQTVSHPHNQVNMAMHFDLCSDSGASAAFFPKNRGAMVGMYEEVSCNQWAGSAGQKLWNGACLAPEDAAFWPSMSNSCGNEGNPPA